MFRCPLNINTLPKKDKKRHQTINETSTTNIMNHPLPTSIPQLFALAQDAGDVGQKSQVVRFTTAAVGIGVALPSVHFTFST